MKILIFTEGTVIMPSSTNGLSRDQIVELVKNNDPSADDFSHYIPNSNVVEKLKQWKFQGAEIYYLTSRTTTEEVAIIQKLLEQYNFPNNKNLLFRKAGEEYKDVAEKLMPDILIEDDCESIGGEIEMTYPHIREELKQKIKSVVVKEFGGIDHLSNDIKQL